MTSVNSSRDEHQLDAELRKLLDEYLPRLQTLGAELLSVLGTQHGGEAHARAVKLSHRIHGTSGSYGLAEVAAAAGEIEDALQAGDAAAVKAAAAKFKAALAGL